MGNLPEEQNEALNLHFIRGQASIHPQLPPVVEEAPVNPHMANLNDCQLLLSIDKKQLSNLFYFSCSGTVFGRYWRPSARAGEC